MATWSWLGHERKRFLTVLTTGIFLAVVVLVPTSDVRFRARLVGGHYQGNTTTTTSNTPTTLTTPTTTSNAPTTSDNTPTTTSEEPQLILSAQQGRGGDAIVVTGRGFRPIEQIDLLFMSTPVPLGTFQTDDRGNLSAAVVIPSDATPGEHEIVATSSDGEIRARQTFTVLAAALSGAAGQLPRTGFDVFDLLFLAGLLLLLGLSATLAGRRFS